MPAAYHSGASDFHMSLMHLSPRAIGTHKALAGLGRHRCLELGNEISEAAEISQVKGTGRHEAAARSRRPAGLAGQG